MEVKHFFIIIFRSIASLTALFFLTKMLGKKQISQLSLFDYVIGISMGSIAAEMTINMDAPFFDGLIAMAAYSSTSLAISLLSIASIKMRNFFTGTPIVLIQDGKIIRKNLRKSLLDINDLLQECRSNGYFNINAIEYAIIEACGKLSFLPKTPNRSVTLKDLNIKDNVAGLCANVIIDGMIIEKSLGLIKKDKKWLLKELKKQGYKDPESILLATVDPNYKTTVYEKVENIEVKEIL